MTLEGKIVLSIGVCSPDSIVFEQASTEDAIEKKRKLDELHLRKIELADEVFVLNVDGYIGKSTRREIDHAERTGTPVRYLENDG